MHLQLVSYLDGVSVSATHMLSKRNASLFFDQLLRLKTIVKVKLNFLQAFSQFLFVVNSFLTKLFLNSLVSLNCVSGRNLQVTIKFTLRTVSLNFLYHLFICLI